MKLLAIINGDYGKRHIDNIIKHKPVDWIVETWDAPKAFPIVIDYPEDYLPAKLPQSDLILSFAEHKGAAELLPDIAILSGAKSVIASIDNEAWLPRGLARQLRGWLKKINVSCVTPKPLCSLTENEYGVSRSRRINYTDTYISSFARYFGQPSLKLSINKKTMTISKAEIIRDAVCGCARFVADGLTNISVDEAEEKAGLLHHHFPCLASMGIDSDFNDTLLHISGNVIKKDVYTQVKKYKKTDYIRPSSFSDSS